MSDPSLPSFVPYHREKIGGVDFLGLITVNERYMGTLLPGFNNVTYRVRPYSLMCWIAWSFKREAEKLGWERATAAKFKQYREKIELLFSWGHKLNNDDTGMIGNTSEPPSGAKIILKFKEWGRTVSWMDAVNYGPSLKLDNGLGFVVADDVPGVFGALTTGERLAEALDKKLRTSSYYSRTCALEDFVGTSAQAISLYDAWRIGTPTSAEAAIFRDVFYDADGVEPESSASRRSAMIGLVLQTLRASPGAVSPKKLRRRLMTFPILDKGTMAEEMRKSQSLWRVLQVRQAQRLALETLFMWVQTQVLMEAKRTSAELVDDLITSISRGKGDIGADWIRTNMSNFEILKKDYGDLLLAGKRNEDIDFFRLMDRIEANLRSDLDEATALAVRILLLVGCFHSTFQKDPYAACHLDEGGAGRISLQYWTHFLASNRNLPAEYFLTKLIEVLVISQHLSVAASRYSTGKQRLRLSLEESGLVCLLRSKDEIGLPGVTRDRLESLLALMADCKLISRKQIGHETRYSAT